MNNSDQLSAYNTISNIISNLTAAQTEADPAFKRYLLERSEGAGYSLMQILSRIMKAKSHEEYILLMSEREWSKLFFSDVRGQTYRALDGSLPIELVIQNLQEIKAIMLLRNWDND